MNVFHFSNIYFFVNGIMEKYLVNLFTISSTILYYLYTETSFNLSNLIINYIITLFYDIFVGFVY